MADRHNRAIEDRIAEALTRLRHESRMPHKDLAYRVGVSYVAIWNWENGVTFPQSLANLRKWAEALGAKMEFRLTTQDGVETKF